MHPGIPTHNDSPRLLPPPFYLFYPQASCQHARSFVSAARVLAALRHLHCEPIGERGLAAEHWITPKGVRFLVDDPVADGGSAPVVTASGRRSLYYSYPYAYALLARAQWLVAYALPQDAPQALDPSLLLVELAVPPAEARHRPLPALGETMFI